MRRSHDAPGFKLGTRIVTLAVIVEEIRDREWADNHRITNHRPHAGELILIAFHFFFFPTEADIVGKIQASEIRLGSGGGDSGDFTVGRVGQPVHIAQALAAGDFRIEIEPEVIIG